MRAHPTLGTKCQSAITGTARQGGACGLASPPERKEPADGLAFELLCAQSRQTSRTDNFMSWAIVDIGKFLESLTGS